MEEGKAENLTESLLGEEARSVGEVGIKWTSVELWKEESKKLWHIAGPSIFTRVTSYSMNIVTQAFAGHLGDLELASISIGNTVVLGFNFGLILGMASALETLCGQAFGAKKHHMLGIYLQRSWIVLFFCCVLLLPIYIFTTPLLKLLGQPDDIAEQTGIVALWFIPMHFSFGFLLPMQRFLQSQIKVGVMAWVSLAVFLIHAVMSWIFVYQFKLGVIGIALALGIANWLIFFGLLWYVIRGGCPQTWTGLSLEAFSGIWDFFKLSAASGVMLCLENWYFRILILMTGYLKDATVAVDALSICMNVNGWEMMIPFAFFAATGVRVANELGAGNGKAAKFATVVSVCQSSMIGSLFSIILLVLHDKFALIFTTSSQVLEAVDKLSYLLAITILLNSIQPVAYVNLGCYYLVGIPLGIVFGWTFNYGVEGMWGGMIIGGTAMQTVVLVIMTLQCNWEKEAEKAVMHVQKWSSAHTNPTDEQS
ncbi:hypothetical protein DCAR_0522087 [Daucus carota subsp. sativus]|uniref:Protein DETOXIFICATION n=1 Tax=Daucus carota subsp. sativus TaxID=79200 RepID=A0AAF0X751_DAUCS|nr:hypothetical protein DCAR_0522087 [Daucus carota subsp. sativus]